MYTVSACISNAQSCLEGACPKLIILNATTDNPQPLMMLKRKTNISQIKQYLGNFKRTLEINEEFTREI